VTAQLLDWLQRAEFDATPSPAVLVQECLISSIQRRVHTVSQQLLARLMGEWRLMEELALLRAIYLVSSGQTYHLLPLSDILLDLKSLYPYYWVHSG
jgi:hypothetical protein